MSHVAELVKLPVAERLALIDELWASISEKEISIEPAQVSEVQARWHELKADPTPGLSCDELKARLG
ncbi:MAG: addiction module protein [Opitutaceae bacterium]